MKYCPNTAESLDRFPEGNTETNVTVIVTNVGADFTSLGSFGEAQGFGENLVSSMDRSFLLKTPKWTHPKEGIQVGFQMAYQHAACKFDAPILQR